jgi:ferrous iron transport protein B
MQNIGVADPRETKTRQILVALAGNPNAGKTTLFNAITGLRQKVANYPGVTVERKEGMWRLSNEERALVIDLPGLYSLNASSPDEEIARDAMSGAAAGSQRPDVIIAVVDATNLERNLYLFTQVLEHGIPVVIALTMMDEAEKRGIVIDRERLAAALGVQIIETVAKDKRGLKELAAAVSRAAAEPARSRENDFRNNDHLNQAHSQVIARYGWIARVVSDSVKDETASEPGSSAKIDRILTHRFLGPVILVLILLLIFQSIFSWARLPMDLLDSAFGALANFARSVLPPGAATDLLTDGIIAGVGGVLVFVPQIVLLFFFITILEDTGYMARAAFMLDRLMRSIGLHGKAFVPLLSSFACAIPGIMAARTIENPKDRLTTILIAPWMSCSARLPVYTLMIGGFFGGQYVFGFLSVGALLILSMYALGLIAAVIVALILKRTILKAPPPPLVMELPPYRMPNFKVVVVNVTQRAGMFVRRAGTIILAISIVLWALANFPRPAAEGADGAARQSELTAEEQKSADTAEQNRRLSYSLAGRLGRVVEPVIRPLGYDWKIGIGLISSYAARETFVSTMSILYNVGKDEGADSGSLLEGLRNAKREDGSPVWTPLLALSTMLFYLFSFQCVSTFSIVKRETNSWRWPIFMAGYMTIFGYLISFLTYQGGRMLGF